MGKVLSQGFYPVFGDICIAAAAAALYMLLSTAGYLAGALIRINKGFIFIIPAVFVGALGLRYSPVKNQGFLAYCWSLIVNEKSIALFALRVIVAAAVLFALSIAVTNRMEVRK
jgi:hypothetical protein